MRPTHPEPFGARWRGRWIWHERPAIRAATATRPVLDRPVDTVALFRRRFELDTDPERAVCRLWVDGRYVLTVNGTDMARGPVRSDPRRAHYDVVDLAGVLHAGTNVVAVTARHFGEATSWWTPVPPTYSLGAGCLVFEAAVDDRWVVSDRSWACRPGDAWTAVPVPGDVASLPLESVRRRTPSHRLGGARVRRGRLVRCRRDRPGAHRCPPGPATADGAVRHAAPAGSGGLPFGLAPRRDPRRGPPCPGADPVEDPVRQVLADERAGADGDADGGGGADGHRRGPGLVRPRTHRRRDGRPGGDGRRPGNGGRRGRRRTPRRSRPAGTPRPARRLPLRLSGRWHRAVRDLRRPRCPPPARQHPHG